MSAPVRRVCPNPAGTLRCRPISSARHALRYHTALQLVCERLVADGDISAAAAMECVWRGFRASVGQHLTLLHDEPRRRRWVDSRLRGGALLRLTAGPGCTDAAAGAALTALELVDVDMTEATLALRLLRPGAVLVLRSAKPWSGDQCWRFAAAAAGAALFSLELDMPMAARDVPALLAQLPDVPLITVASVHVYDWPLQATFDAVCTAARDRRLRIRALTGLLNHHTSRVISCLLEHHDVADVRLSFPSVIWDASLPSAPVSWRAIHDRLGSLRLDVLSLSTCDPSLDVLLALPVACACRELRVFTSKSGGSAAAATRVAAYPRLRTLHVRGSIGGPALQALLTAPPAVGLALHLSHATACAAQAAGWYGLTALHSTLTTTDVPAGAPAWQLPRVLKKRAAVSQPPACGVRRRICCWLHPEAFPAGGEGCLKALSVGLGGSQRHA